MNPYYSPEELADFGFLSLGTDVRISRKCSIYGARHIRLGDHVRVDDFSVLTAREEMVLGDYVHVSCLSFLHGYRSIRIGNFSQISSRVGLYTSSADCSGETFTNPLLPAGFTGEVEEGAIILGDYAVIGTGATVLQGVTVGEGGVVGANALVKSSLAEWTISGGIPARFLKERKRDTVRKLGQMILNNTP